MILEKGTKLIYKGNVCIIEEILKNYYKELDYYALSQLSDPSLTIKVPVDFCKNDIRNIISKEDALKLIKRIPEINPIEIDKNNEKNLENIYKQILSDDDYDELVSVIKTTYLRNQEKIDSNKKISEKDNNYFNKAEKKLYEELSIALDFSEEEIRKQIMDYCNH